MKPVFMCEICGTIHSTETDAKYCETKHPDKDTMKIVSINYFQLLTDPNHMHIKVPRKITIRFSDRFDDYATYVFERYGPKGM